MTRKQFIKAAMDNGYTKNGAIKLANLRKEIQQERKEGGRDDWQYSYEDFYDDEFGINRFEQEMDSENEQLLYDNGLFYLEP